MQIICQNSALQKQWIQNSVTLEQIEPIKINFKLSYLTASVLASRNVAFEEIENFLDAKLKNTWLNPAKLPDIENATTLLAKFVKEKRKIGILGDYDVDGLTASAIWKEILENFEIHPEIWIPSREQGYGPSKEALDFFHEKGTQLLILVDCGSTSHEFIKNFKGEIIIIDHHAIDSLPKCQHIINPHRNDLNCIEFEDFRKMCAAGLSFLVAHHFLQKTGLSSQKKQNLLLKQLDLVALGTVCDVMELNAFNKSLVKSGLKQIEKQDRPGIKAIVQLSKMQIPITTQDIGFTFGPRLNAAGRINNAMISFELLTTKCDVTALKLAQQLEFLNQERKQIQENAFQEAALMAEQEKGKIICLASKNWHAGIIGIVAAMIQEKYERPCIIGSITGNEIKASARSNKINVGNLIKTAVNNKIIKSGGGHALAGGLACTLNEWEAFKIWIEENATECLEKPTLTVDITIDINAIEDDFNKLGPFGPGNEEIIILSKEIIINHIVKNERYTRITLMQNFQTHTFFLFKRDMNLIQALEKSYKENEKIDVLLKLSEKGYHRIIDYKPAVI